MPQGFFQRLAVLFEYTCVSNCDDLLQIAREAQKNKSKMPNGELFITEQDPITKKNMENFLLAYGKKYS